MKSQTIIMHPKFATPILLLATTTAFAAPAPGAVFAPRALGDTVSPSVANCHPEDGVIPKSVVQAINLDLDNKGAVDNGTPCCPSDQGVKVTCSSEKGPDGKVYDLSVLAEAPGMKDDKKYCIGSAALANYVADFESGLPGSGCLTPDGNGVDTVWQAVWQDDGLNIELAIHQ